MKTESKPESKPLTAFEVYALKKTPDAASTPPLSKRKLKKLRKNELLQAKKLKEAAAQLAEETKHGGRLRDDVVIRSGAVKSTKVDGGKAKVSNGVGPKGKNRKKKKSKKGKSVAEGNEDSKTDGEESVGGKAKENGDSAVKSQRISRFKGDLKRKGAPDNSENDAEGAASVKQKSRQADLKKKIAEIKKLVNKKGDARNSRSSGSDDVDPSDQSLESDEMDEDDVIESDGLAEGDETFHVPTFTGAELKAVGVEDSRKQGQETFKWVIHPHSEKEFFSKYWEKAPLLVKRQKKDHYKGLFSTQDLDNILHEQVVIYTKNLDVTSYSDGKRETHNPIGQAHAPVVWDYYNNGCSIRMLNPQTFHPRVWKCLSSLQEYFNSFCGANVYLTPPDTQGFAPHWDDIEAFVIQLEGKKRWRVYKPRCDEEVLPDYSSPNLEEDGIGEPILDTVLEPGDLLYFPRGFIHQGHAVKDEHSLHITLSTYQKNAWGHYLEKLLPQALSLAMSEDVEFRKGLPRDYLDHMGIVHTENTGPVVLENGETEDRRSVFKKKVCDLVMRMMDNAPLDAVADQLGSSFIHDCLPPYLTKEDRICSVYGGGEKWCPKKKKVINRVELQPDTHVRLIRGNCIRLVAEDENVHIYHCLENSREYHKEEPQFLEVAAENAPAVEALIHSYPYYITIESLPLQDEVERMTIASGLWERGLLVSANQLDAQYDD